MTATWALVYMLCTRSCVAQYAIPYDTRKECVRNIPKQEGMMQQEKYVCIPLSKD
jgi:hypothetical protein